MASSDDMGRVKGLGSGFRIPDSRLRALDSVPRTPGAGFRALGPEARARHRRRVGRFGEDLAARFLVARGVRILGRNVRVGRGEIDLHADIGGESVAVEVKMILAPDPGDDALHQFTPEKARTLRRYAVRLSPPARRVDLVTVTGREWGVEVRWLPYSA